jgi:hypothetical protein
MNSNCHLVIIRWQDSRQPCGQWRFLHALPEAKAVEVASVGWLVKDTEDVKVLCQNIGDLGFPDQAQASGIMTIPTRCVLSIERLTEVEETNASVGPAGSAGQTDCPDPAGSADFAGPAAGGRGLEPAPMRREIESLPA